MTCHSAFAFLCSGIFCCGCRWRWTNELDLGGFGWITRIVVDSLRVGWDGMI